MKSLDYSFKVAFNFKSRLDRNPLLLEGKLTNKRNEKSVQITNYFLK